MTCEEFEEISGAYALGAVTPAEREAARAHLATCPKCSLLLEHLQDVVDLLPLAAPQVNPPTSAKDRLLAAIREEGSSPTPEPAAGPQRVTRPRRRLWLGWNARLLAVAALCLLLLLGGASIWNISLSRQASVLAQQVSTLRQKNGDLAEKNQALARNISVLQRQVAMEFPLQGAQGIRGKLII
jgi:anti-sigma factor RsiW